MASQYAASADIRPKAGRSALATLVLVLLGALTLLTPAIINGYPFLFFDTKSYDELGKSTVSHLLELIKPETPVAEPSGGAGPELAAPVADKNDSMTYAGGRSPYYSLFIYLGEAAGPLWIVAVIQALMAAWVLFLTARSATPERTARTYALVVGGLTLGSSLPFYSAFAMPDVLTGIAILSTAVLAIWFDRLSLLERLALVVVATFAASAHSTNPPLMALTLILFALIVFVLRQNIGSLRQRALWAGAPLVLALAAGAAYSTTTSIVLGDTPHSPPYLMARVLADGPGRTYLKEVCANGEPYEICRYKNQPLDAHNDILWSPDPKVGVFQLADSAGRHRLIDQERDFVLKTFAAHPGAQIAAFVRNSFAQFHTFTVSAEVGLARRSWDEMGFAALMPSETAAATKALAYRGSFPFKAVDRVGLAALLLSIGFLLWRLSRVDALAAYRKPAADDTARSLAAFAAVSLAVVLLLLANSILCGSLSGVHDRYQARLIWLLPLMALLVLARFGARPEARQNS